MTNCTRSRYIDVYKYFVDNTDIARTFNRAGNRLLYSVIRIYITRTFMHRRHAIFNVLFLYSIRTPRLRSLRFALIYLLTMTTDYFSFIFFVIVNLISNFLVDQKERLVGMIKFGSLQKSVIFELSLLPAQN